jgi:hypothetical protein
VRFFIRQNDKQGFDFLLFVLLRLLYFEKLSTNYFHPSQLQQHGNSPPLEGRRKFFRIFDGVLFNSMIFLAPIETVTPQQELALKESDGARSKSG